MSDYTDKLKLASKVDVQFDADEPFEIEVKRFSIPGLTFTSTCPHCGEQQEYIPDYFSYPCANGHEQVAQECESCGEEYRFEIRLDVTVEVLWAALDFGRVAIVKSEPAMESESANV